MDYETIKKENQLLKDENERLKNELIQTSESTVNNGIGVGWTWIIIESKFIHV